MIVDLEGCSAGVQLLGLGQRENVDVFVVPASVLLRVLVAACDLSEKLKLQFLVVI